MKGFVLDDATLLMTRDDNVATAIDDIDAGTTLAIDEAPGDRDELTLPEPIEFGHKLALVEIPAGEPVYKYGEVIGTATERIGPGEWVHAHNCESNRGRGDLAGAEANA